MNLSKAEGIPIRADHASTIVSDSLDAARGARLSDRRQHLGQHECLLSSPCDVAVTVLGRSDSDVVVSVPRLL